MKALGRGFSSAPFKTFTVRFRDATDRNLTNFSSEVSHSRFLLLYLYFKRAVKVFIVRGWGWGTGVLWFALASSEPLHPLISATLAGF